MYTACVYDIVSFLSDFAVPCLALALPCLGGANLSPQDSGHNIFFSSLCSPLPWAEGGVVPLTPILTLKLL